MTKKKIREQRRYSRSPVSFKVDLLTDSSRGQGQLVDVSMGGLLINNVLDVAVGVGDAVSLSVELGGGILVNADGVVVRVSNSHCAIEFSSVHPGSLGHLQRLVVLNNANPSSAEQQLFASGETPN